MPLCVIQEKSCHERHFSELHLTELMLLLLHGHDGHLPSRSIRKMNGSQAVILKKIYSKEQYIHKRLYKIVYNIYTISYIHKLEKKDIRCIHHYRRGKR